MSSVIVSHNRTTLSELEPGDMVKFGRGLYSHWAVYEGNEKVIHMTGIGNGRVKDHVNSGQSLSICGVQYDKAEVREDNFWDVAGKDKAYKDNDKDNKHAPLKRNEILEKATKMEGPIQYNVLWNNCEHFASYCRYGKGWSDQVGTAEKGLLFGVGVAAAALGTVAMMRRNKEKN